MEKVIGVNFNEGGPIYYFLNEKLELNIGDAVIVNTERGSQLGYVVKTTIDIDYNNFKEELKTIIRKADDKDIAKHEQNIKDATSAIDVCRKLIAKYNLDMQIIDASFTFNREQLMFHFVSSARVDFRELAKELATIYKTRIELRQVGIRDKAKKIGGLGVCGRELCCCKFLKEFDSVSINMAKNQNISLNPSKINGACGRLLCCLKYEDECYKECRQNIPNVGKKVMTDKGEGKVVSIDILQGKYKVEIPEVGIIEIDVKNNGSN